MSNKNKNNGENKEINLDALPEDQRGIFDISDLPEEGLNIDDLSWDEIKTITEDIKSSTELSIEVTNVVSTMLEKDQDKENESIINELKGINESFKGIKETIKEIENSEYYSKTGKLKNDDEIFDFIPIIQDVNDLNDRAQDINKHLFVDVVPRIKSIGALEEINNFGKKLRTEKEGNNDAK